MWNQVPLFLPVLCLKNIYEAVTWCVFIAPQGALYDIVHYYRPTGQFFRFSLSPRHIATALAPKHYNMINARPLHLYIYRLPCSKQSRAEQEPSKKRTRSEHSPHLQSVSLSAGSNFFTPAAGWCVFFTPAAGWCGPGFRTDNLQSTRLAKLNGLWNGRSAWLYTIFTAHLYVKFSNSKLWSGVFWAA